MNLLPLGELRFAVRRLRKDLGSTIASVAALACAIGAAVATWSLVSAVLLKPLPIDTQRLFIVDSPPPAETGRRTSWWSRWISSPASRRWCRSRGCT